MTNEQRSELKQQLSDTIRYWNQCEEYHQVQEADRLMRRIERIQAQLDAEV